ncbi:(deoxy)nucleoside triphosphate pyrophosphohydrolase [Actinokineospora sp.]|uniref:(deoxy)nucleoside triphosphate pyrophosphohydrolase n=1 Tax=Actinokineospora sp. TaxID=1872133 RepID=UPI0040384E3B
MVAPGDEIRLGWSRLRIVHLDTDGLCAVSVAGFPAALRVRVARAGAGSSVTCSGRLPRAWLAGLVERVSARALELATARVVVGAAIVRDGRVLVQQRAYPAEVAGMWELPGGRVEVGESDVDAVARECREELGVEVVATTMTGPDVALRNDLVLRVYAARMARGEPRAHDHQAVRWLTEDALHTVPWLPADRVLLPAIARLLRADG